MSFKYAVALTGSIGTGKSSAARVLATLGFEMIDADSIAHEILDQEYQSIATLFGEMLVKECKVDRKALGAIVFSDDKQRTILENLLHPLIYKEIEQRALMLDKREQPYLIDIPLFFEGRRYPIEKVLVVYAPFSLQIERVMQRDGFSQEEAQKRIATQISIEEKRKKADYVIDNSGTLTQLESECKRIQHLIQKDFR